MNVVARLVVCSLALLIILPAPAQDWPHWRGPNYDGSADVKGIPDTFSKFKNVKWKTKMPGPSACTPIVVGERIFLSSVDSKRDKLVAMCINRQDGHILWKHDAGSGYPGGTGGRRSNYSSPSPATDGKNVVFFFGNGDLVGFGHEGMKRWSRNLQKDYGQFAFQWTFSASPTIWEGKLFLPILQRDVPVGRRGGDGSGDKIKSFLLAIDPATGKTIYKHDRPSPARMESLECYATLIPFVRGDGRKELLCVGGDVLTGHDPASGKELWRWGTWNEGHRQRAWRLVPTVVSGDGVAVICAPKRAPVYAIKLGGDGKLDAKALAWKSQGRPNNISSDVPSPAYRDGHFYVLSDVQYALSKVNAKTGKVVWSTEVPRDYLWRASPTINDGKVYCINHTGLVIVVDAKSGKIVHKTFMGEVDDDQIRSSVVVAHRALFIRTWDTLYCIGK
ncbi:MAG: hypothetical protein CMJ83_16895 [Planctomycetes bacterium]|nr:hypothetical protein [Planctomycetota bacterium]